MGKTPANVRYAEVERETNETRVQVVVDLDGGPKSDAGTGIGFFDHMIDLMAHHGRINLGIKAEGDLHIDDHHTIEDIGIAFGLALRKALLNSPGLERFGQSLQPMDESLVLVAIDICGRGVLVFDAPFTRERIGGMSTEMVREFFRAVSANAGITVHIKKITSENDHHLCEAIFKGFGRALRQAIEPTGNGEVNSTKGKID